MIALPSYAILLLGCVLFGGGCRTARPPERITIESSVPVASLEVDTLGGNDADYECEIIGPDGPRGMLTLVFEESFSQSQRSWFAEQTRDPLDILEYIPNVKVVVGRKSKDTAQRIIDVVLVAPQLRERGLVEKSQTDGMFIIWLGTVYDETIPNRVAHIRSGIEHLDELQQMIGRDGKLRGHVQLQFRRR